MLEPELIEHEVDAAMQYLETEWWLEGASGRRLEVVELVDPTRRSVARCHGECGRARTDGKALCERCWQHVPEVLRKALFRAWHRWQREPGDADRHERYRSALDLCIAEAGETVS
jgi:hypothetical protein